MPVIHTILVWSPEFVPLVFVNLVLSAVVRILFVAPSTIFSISNASHDTFVGSYVEASIFPPPDRVTFFH